MRRSRLLMIGTVAVVGMTLAACGGSKKSSPAPTTSGGVTVPTGGGGTTVDVGLGDTKGLDAPMTMTVSPASVAAGKVTFVAKNTGTITHELVVLKTDTPFDQLVVGADKKVSEDTSQGETGDVDKGTTKSVTLDLAPGRYVLVCNIEGHYKMGMRAAFTVT